MKRASFCYPSKIIFVTLFLFTNISLAQYNWEWQNPKPQGNNLSAIYFTDSNTGYFTGMGGAILKTTDGGISWISQDSNINEILFSTKFVNRDTGFIVGGYGTILKTTNGGNEWINKSVSPDNHFENLFFTDETTGYIVGWFGQIWKTTNAGDDWTILPTGTTQVLLSIFFTNADTGYAVGSGGILLKTTDTGNSWTQQILGTNNFFGSICFINENTGFIAGSSGLLKTTDAGDTWTAINNGSGSLSSVYFIDSLIGYASGGHYSKIFKTTDGGNTWNLQKSLNYELSEIFFTDTSTGYTSGEFGNILKTTDGGNSWLSLVSGTYYPLKSIYFIPESGSQIGYVAGNNDLLKTTNRGENWVEMASPGTSLKSIIFISEDVGIVVGAFNKIYKTTDGGVSWVPETSGYSPDYYSVCFPSDSTGYISGSGGTILKSTDQGETWFNQSSGTSSNLLAISFINENIGMAAGENGTIFKTTNGGTDWNSLTSGILSKLNSIKFIDANTCIIVGDNGIILKTINGGVSWNTVPSGTQLPLNSVSFNSSNGLTTGYAVGGDQSFRTVVLRTTDNGDTWVQQPIPVTNILYSVYAADSNNTYIVGLGGTIIKISDDVTPVELTSFTATPDNHSVILKWTTSSETNNNKFEIERNEGEWKTIGFVYGNGTTTKQHFYSYIDKNLLSSRHQFRLKQIDFDGSYKYSEVIDVKIEFVNSFDLLQNYPNPFNPTTTIKYSIPSVISSGARNLVTLKVYDVLGNEIATLVNEEKPAGEYEVNFDASKLASGIYFYQLRTSSFVQTKKMILLK